MAVTGDGTGAKLHPGNGVMEAAPQQKTGLNDWTERFSTSLNRHRDRVREFLCAHRERLTRAEGELTVQLRSLAEQLAHEHAESRQARDDLEAQRRAIAAEAAALERLRGKFEHRDSQWDRVQTGAIDQQQQLLERLLRHQEEMERQCRELAAAHAENTAAASGLEHQLRQEVASLKAQRQDLQRLEAAKDDSKTAEYDALLARLAEARKELAEKNQLLAAAESRILALKQGLADSHASHADQPSVAGSAAASGAADVEIENLRRRYAMAVDDLQNLRAHNDELQQQVSRLRSEGNKPSAATAQVLDWEAEKRRILAALEQETTDTEEAKATQNGIQKVVERTDRILAEKDRVLAEKDREIAELKTLLENQSANVGAMAVGAVALGGILDSDEIIREQREGLKQLQEDLQKKLREAEIETSLERAKIARQRTELEERIRKFEEQGLVPVTEAHPKDTPQKGRWLSRLGLKEDEHK